MKRLSTYFFPKLIAFAAGLLLFPSALLADGPPKKSALDNPLAMVLIIVIVALGVVILLFGYVLSNTAQYYMQQEQEKEAAKTKPVTKTMLLLLLCFTGISALAQDASESIVIPDRSVGGLPQTTFIALLSVIFLELIVILSMAFFIKRLLAKVQAPEEVAADAPEKEPVWQRWWQRANNFRSLKEEASIDMGHEYDNIRELDNRLPPWWLYGFYCTIIFAAVYLWRFEVAHSAPSSLQEYTTAIQKAEEEKEAYLAKAANQVDENTVQMLDASGIDQGKTIFTSTCAPCHGPDGGGTVGPNLTDDYWLHGGSLKNIFKTIKYGVQEKGMKSWKDDFSPVQIAQLTSFVKSLHGVKAANPKEAQGELYTETAAADSTGKAIDSTQKDAPIKK